MPAIVPQTCGIRLREALPECEILGPQELRTATCCSDPKRCRPGDLFVAVSATEFDGHDFAFEAIQRGASAILVERMLPVDVPQVLVRDTRVAYGQLCQALVDNPTRSMTTIAVCGSHGKTTIAKLLSAVLRTAGKRVGEISSIGQSDGFVEYKGQSPASPPELAHALAEMQAAGCTHAVVEISARELAQRKTEGLEFDAVIVANMRRERAPSHGSLKNLRRAQTRILHQLKSHGFAVLNADDSCCQKLLPELTCPTMTVSEMADAEITACNVELLASEQTVLISAGDNIMPLRTRMIGRPHTANCLLVTATALALGIDLPTIVRGLEAVESVPLRMERVECGQPFNVFLDTAASPDRLANSLKTARQIASGRVICIANACDDLPREDRALLGRVLERHAHIGLIASDGSSRQTPLQLIHDVLDGYQRPAKAHVMPDRQQAIEWVLSQAKPGDCILITGCRTQAYTRSDGTYADPQDAETVRDWLYEVPPHNEDDIIAFKSQ